MSLLGISAGAMAAVGAAVAPTHVATVLPAAVQAAFTPAPATPAPPPAQSYSVDPTIAPVLAEWNSLRQADNYPFSSYANFLLAHPGWPGEASMRKTAEKAINPDSTPASQVVSYFHVFPPLTNVGQARLAYALFATGRAEDAREAARLAWTGGPLPTADESRILTYFSGGLKPDDHDARIAALLAAGKAQDAQRNLPLASPARRPVFEAEIAFQTNAPDINAKMAAVPTSAETDAGYLRDKANWLRNGLQAPAARQLLAGRGALTVRPADPEPWFETLVTLAREAAHDGQWSTAYGIASKMDDAYPAGTDVSDRPYGERDAYTSLAWIGGTAALKIGRPADAIHLFDLYAHGARSPQTRSKGFYWAARAAATAGHTDESQSYYEQSSAAPDQFYGQLAIEKLGRHVPAPPVTSAMPTDAERAAFLQRDLVRAARALGLMGRWQDQTQFVRAIAQQAKTDSERQLATDFGRQIGRLDLGVWVAREARSKGESFYARGSFPDVPIAPGFARYWALAQAITRQESSFDRMAVSNAGARGMMQLMPGTARQQANALSLPYDFGRLTSDPSYNMMLGTGYFSTLLDQWGGNAALAVASYNAGVGNVRKWVAQNGDPRMPGTDMVRWIEDIPFAETRNYVQRVLENAVVYDTLAPGGGQQANRLSFYLGKSSAG
ncbi:MAG TPA: lytic transglycosylase domain-containing protein [Allosphingosinicella sp.]|nr:lytic transglycosylase domain-containing protein [Allosphingosinicella sp.]